VAEKTCPTCGDQNVHANIPSEIIACATRKALVDALHAYAEMIDERSYPMQYMRLSIAQVLQAEAVALLPGWVNSRGATLERRIATALGLLVGAVADFLGGEPS